MPFFSASFNNKKICITSLDILSSSSADPFSISFPSRNYHSYPTFFSPSSPCPRRDVQSSCFLLAAAWVDPGRSTLQSAEQRCQRRYGRIHQGGWMSIYDKNMQKGQFESNTQKESNLEEMFNPQLCLLILYSRDSTGTRTSTLCCATLHHFRYSNSTLHFLLSPIPLRNFWPSQVYISLCKASFGFWAFNFLMYLRILPSCRAFLLPSPSCFWNCTAWLGLALAAFRAFLRCLRLAKPK